MTEQDNASKAKPFFDRAAQIVETGNWDYAIEMYLQGISRDPSDIERGHEKLREASLARKANGGKKPGFLEAMKRKPGKDPLENLVNAEWLMSRDPANTTYWRQIISAAKDAQLPDVLKWAINILYEVNRTASKPSKDVYLFMTEAATEAQLFSDAVRCCQAALQLDPNNPQLGDQLRDLSARDTMQKGKYDEGAKFTESVKDMGKQIELLKQDQLSQDRRFVEGQIAKARAAYEAEPTVPGKITALVDELVKVDDEAYENEAIDVLTKAHKDTGAYRYKMRIGDIKIRQMTRRYRRLVAAGDKEAAQKQAQEQLAFELEEYGERASNYPTDLGLKFELGRRQFLAGQYDEAIASLQQARRDPKRRNQAMNYLGLAFFKKGWYNEAAETYEEALKAEMSESRSKDLRYNLASIYLAKGDKAKALELFSDVAQIDYNYKDVRQQIERIRKDIEAGEGS